MRKGCPPDDCGALGAALQNEGPESGAIGAKWLWAPGGTTQTHPGIRAEATGQIFGQERTLGPARTREERGQTVQSHLPGLRGRIYQLRVI